MPFSSFLSVVFSGSLLPELCKNQCALSLCFLPLKKRRINFLSFFLFLAVIVVARKNHHLEKERKKLASLSFSFASLRLSQSLDCHPSASSRARASKLPSKFKKRCISSQERKERKTIKVFCFFLSDNHHFLSSLLLSFSSFFTCSAGARRRTRR